MSVKDYAIEKRVVKNAPSFSIVLLSKARKILREILELILFIRAIAATLLAVWFVLVLLGKGGFIHLVLLAGIGFAVVELVSIYRRRMSE